MGLDDLNADHGGGDFINRKFRNCRSDLASKNRTHLLTISRQSATDKSLRKVTIPLTHGEAAVLEAALRAAIGRILAW